MADTQIITPYATAMPYITASLPSWVNDYDAQRIASYDLYDDLFHNQPGTYRMMLRNSDEKPIYVPVAKRLISTLARYVGRGWGYAVDPDAGTPEERKNAIDAFGQLFRRERLLSQFTSGKTEWLRRGDWVWYITADPSKRAGRRISVRTVDPRSYFHIADENDADRTAGVMLVEESLEADGTTVSMKVQRWVKANHPDHPLFGEEEGDDDPHPIAYEVAVYDYAEWESPDKRKTLRMPVPMELLEGVFSIPVYNIRNNEQVSNPYGRSDLAGVESLIAGINQATSDEDLSLAMMGIGMYVTDSGAPVNDDGEEENWILGPDRVVEVAEGRYFKKVEGIASVAPSQEHISFLQEQAYGTAGVNEIALGQALGSTQASGRSLEIRIQPIFDAADEKDLAINDTFNQIFHDLKDWFSTYEGIELGETIVTSAISAGERLPFDREARWKELVEGYTAKIFSLNFVLAELSERFGYSIPADMASEIESALKASAEAEDPYAVRVASEVPAEDEDGAEEI